MKFRSIAISIICICIQLPKVNALDYRQVTNLNRDWYFTMGDTNGAEAPQFDESDWQRVGLPHSFSIPYFAGGNEFYVGFGWYRKVLELSTQQVGKRVFLDFEGVFQVAEIFVNGEPVGHHEGGYTGFEIEITDWIKPGENQIAIRVNNLWNPRIAPRAGEHTFSGGIYRNVWLVLKDPLHVTWYGTYVTTPEINEKSCKVRVETEVVNQSKTTKVCTIRQQILNPEGVLVTDMLSFQPIHAGQTQVFEQVSEPIADPALWSPSNPHLYSVITTVFDGDDPVDQCESPLGFRWFEFAADQGFFLNGEPLYLKGANVHQDHAGWGDAVTESGFFRDVNMMKEAGFNFIRGSHYPHAPAFSRACDQLGMVFWSEGSFWGTYGFDSPWASSAYPEHAADEQAFQESVKDCLRDMVRIHRNHPSIVVWSTGNEVFFSDQKVLPKARSFLRELVDFLHELDATRPVAIGGCQRGEMDKIGDIAGYNGDGARLFPDPGIPNLVSEYGSTISYRPGKFEPGWGDLPLTPGADPDQPFSWRLPWRSGEAIWCAFDHGSVAGRDFGAMGIVDYFRLPKRQWYWYRMQYRGIAPPQWPQDGDPAGIQLSSDKFKLLSVDGRDDVLITATIIDRDGKPLINSPSVTLTIESGPGQFPTGRTIQFDRDSDIAIRDGKAAIEFRSYYAGETLISASSPGLRGDSIRIISEGKPEWIEGHTPVVEDRPYVRYTTQVEQPVEGSVFGVETPTRASSEREGSSALYANDRDPETIWRAGENDTSPWLRIDLERIVSVNSVQVSLLGDGASTLRIEVSEDGNDDWQLLGEQHVPIVKSETLKFTPDCGLVARFVRVSLEALSWEDIPGISDVEVIGTININPSNQR